MRPDRPREPRPPADEEIGERKLRALSEPFDVRWIVQEPYPRVEVRNPVRKSTYLTFWPAYPERDGAMCTCTDFARRGLGDCKHLEAAWHWLRSRTAATRATSVAPEVLPPADELWAEIDRRLSGPPPLRERDVRELNRIGNAMFEGP